MGMRYRNCKFKLQDLLPQIPMGIETEADPIMLKGEISIQEMYEKGSTLSLSFASYFKQSQHNFPTDDGGILVYPPFESQNDDIFWYG